jgi:hypothetical protein
MGGSERDGERGRGWLIAYDAVTHETGALASANATLAAFARAPMSEKKPVGAAGLEPATPGRVAGLRRRPGAGRKAGELKHEGEWGSGEPTRNPARGSKVLSGALFPPQTPPQVNPDAARALGRRSRTMENDSAESLSKPF